MLTILYRLSRVSSFGSDLIIVEIKVYELLIGFVDWNIFRKLYDVQSTEYSVPSLQVHVSLSGLYRDMFLRLALLLVAHFRLDLITAENR